MGSDLITELAGAAAADPAYAGGKGASLAAMVRSGLPVPGGFVISTAAYRRHVAERGLDAMIDAAVKRATTDADTAGADTTGADTTGADTTGADTAEAASAELRAAFEEGPAPAWLREALAPAYRALGEPPVAVRSSATAEDLPTASFAGQQESVLDVSGLDAVCAAVRRCWSSLWTARALAYRREQDVGEESLAMAVVVQRMVPAELAGVLFTADPVTGRRDRVVVEAVPGLGEALVSGRVTPDRWVLDAASGRVLSRTGRSVTGLPAGRLAELGARAAALFGGPQDVEWAVAGGECLLLQSRPITSLFPLPAAPPGDGPRVYLAALLVAQGIAEPLTPAGNAFMAEVVGRWIRYLWSGSYGRPGEPSAAGMPVLACRLYGDITPLLLRPRLAYRVAARLRTKDPQAEQILTEWLRANSARLPRPRGASLPRGLARVAPGILTGLAAALAAPARTRRRLVARADRRLADAERRSAALTSPRAQVDVATGVLPVLVVRLVVEQLAPVCAEILLRVLAEGLVRRWLGTVSAMEPVRRWLPYDPTMAMGAELARLAGRAGEPSPADPEVRRFLAGYGHRAPSREIDLGLPRLADDPAYVMELIRGYRHSGEAASRFAEGAARSRAAERELVARVRRAKGVWRAAILATVLRRHRELGGLRERPKFDLVRVVALARRTLLRTGVALVERGLLDDPDDVFYLDLADLRRAVTDDAGDGTASRTPGVAAWWPGERAAARRREYRRELRRRRVPRLLVSDGETIYGAAAPAGGPAAGLSGTPVSPGVHEGVVRVLLSPVGANLRPGEVLVAPSTDPGWTPLFLLAGALVMEVGGVISHGSVVAREYGIPAVAGIQDATSRLRTGQRVRVDGENGVVTLLDPG
ncbi:PEP-utilizing enzyme [Actinomadura sp. ATCC 31491]|uniref:PEP-utilizing enzyme n=1 Tax=Actinomadura luzonensis TaxID=2805427 RepID=A0ABT0FMW6_9ACTN|nr:PEP/pyruvate-binding domain-containing protein [Actinomadura luzonensis]MCK2213670.1 PEP-utilizing enzyme [Actinomadura luzonensis]